MQLMLGQIGGGGVLDAMDWENKYKLGEELVLVYKQEELYWQRKGV